MNSFKAFRYQAIDASHFINEVDLLLLLITKTIRLIKTCGFYWVLVVNSVCSLSCRDENVISFDQFSFSNIGGRNDPVNTFNM